MQSSIRLLNQKGRLLVTFFCCHHVSRPPLLLQTFHRTNLPIVAKAEVELVFPGDFNKVVGVNKNLFLQECTATVSKDGAVDVACVNVRTGSIILSLGGSNDAVIAAAQEVVAKGLDLPSFEAMSDADLNECADDSTNDCHAQATCSNTIGSYTCACKTGFVGNGTNCVDVNECAKDNDCHAQATCTNTEGSYTCACKTGFNGSGEECADVNECAKDGDNDCHAQATCTNTEGSYTCACKAGFVGNGKECADVNECAEDGDNDCHIQATCSNTEGNYTCVCKAGFVGNGKECADVNECAEDSDNDCHAQATCTNKAGNYTCACKTGFNGNGKECADVNECAEGSDNDCHAQATCTNTEGSYTCACKAGFVGNGKECADVNECAKDVDNDCHAQATCTNKEGNYTCACKAGFIGDGNECEACADKSVYSDEVGLARCKKCPSGHFGVITAGSKAEGGHTACDDDTCERPTKLPANSVLVDSKCPEHGKQKKTSGTVISQNASTCTLSCKDGFYSSGVIKSFTCLADNELTTASYQGGTITCTGECVSVIDVACDAMFSLLCFANGYESITVLVAFDNYIVCCERGNVWILCQCKKLHCAHLLSMQPTSFAVSANGQ